MLRLAIYIRNIRQSKHAVYCFLVYIQFFFFFTNYLPGASSGAGPARPREGGRPGRGGHRKPSAAPGSGPAHPSQSEVAAAGRELRGELISRDRGRRTPSWRGAPALSAGSPSFSSAESDCSFWFTLLAQSPELHLITFQKSNCHWALNRAVFWNQSLIWSLTVTS